MEAASWKEMGGIQMSFTALPQKQTGCEKEKKFEVLIWRPSPEVILQSMVLSIWVGEGEMSSCV